MHNCFPATLGHLRVATGIIRRVAVTLLPDVLAVAGAAAVIYGLAQLAIWLAWVVGGLILIAAAALLATIERRKSRRSEAP